eukprot:TRINITY_DN14994_c0_g1_i1.p1 TRINITY_DN14994_c0_g1~~TRINITY_DN14994_c0_g1_i1.p1  ORF type:complete len:423 (-),score=51.32 TRINITY_DN14994_c0_g1_i1:88-1356(-)
MSEFLSSWHSSILDQTIDDYDSPAQRRLQSATLVIKAYTVMSIIYIAAILAMTGMLALLFRYLGQRANRARKKKIRHGILSVNTLPWSVRSVVSLFLALFALIPAVLVLSCFIFGPLLALAEGWEHQIGIVSMLTATLGLPNPLPGAVPAVTFWGRILDLLFNMWGLLIGASAMGLCAQMRLVTVMADQMPDGFLGFLRYMFIYLPLLMVCFSLVTGGVICVFEDWSYGDGFYYMAGTMAGIKVTPVRPKSAEGHFITGVFIMVNIGVAGAIIGMVGTNPVVSSFVNLLEGQDGDGGDGSGPIPCAMSVDKLQAAIADGQAKLAFLQKTLSEQQLVLEAKKLAQLPAQEYVVLVPGTVITAGLSLETEDVAALDEGAKVVVEEVKELVDEKRIRGRINAPQPGWISLRDTGDEYMWVRPASI